MNELNVFKKAKELIDNNLISFKGKINIDDSIKFYFEVIGKTDTHQVTLEFKKLEGKIPLFQKFWFCSCSFASMRGLLHSVECSHTLACLMWVILHSEEIEDIGGV